MIKRFLFYLFIFITLSLFNSCKKENFHKIKFEVEFIQDCDNCIGYNVVLVGCKPKYIGDEIEEIDTQNIYDGFVWDYEYWELVDGDEVSFSVQPINPGYVYEIRVYIDGEMVSYRKCRGPHGNDVIDEWGLNNSGVEMGVIKFTYYE